MSLGKYKKNYIKLLLKLFTNVILICYRKYLGNNGRMRRRSGSIFEIIIGCHLPPFQSEGGSRRLSSTIHGGGTTKAGLKKLIRRRMNRTTNIEHEKIVHGGRSTPTRVLVKRRFTLILLADVGRIFNFLKYIVDLACRCSKVQKTSYICNI